MAISLTINGQTYEYPETEDVDWGPDATDWAQAVTTGMLQKAGGLFQLLAETDFGTAYGIKSLYLKSRTANPADAGQVRFAKTDVLNWRNNADDGNLSLGISASDVLQFNGVDIQSSLSVSDTSTIDLTFSSDTLSADIKSDCITNAMINSAAAIAFSKLASLTSGNLLVGSAGNVPTSVALSGDATLVASGALTIAANAVTNAKLAQIATARIKGRVTSGTGDVEDLTGTEATTLLDDFVGDSGSGGTKGLVPAPASGDAASGKFLSAAGGWTVPAGAGDVTGPGSSTDNGFVRFNGTTGKVIKNSAATIVNADVDAAAAIAFSKLATLSSANILVGNGSNVAAAVAVTGDISITNGGVTAYAGTVPLNKGGTGQTTKAAAFDALSPMTTGGDLIYGGASGTGTRLANGSANQYLASAGSTNPPVWTSFVEPTVQKFTSTGSTVGYRFNVTSANATAGATYTNNGNTYTVLSTISGFTLLYCSQAAAPQASGTLTKASGTGDATITFSLAVPIATYTLPTSPRNPLYLRIRMIGGGGGGAGSGSSGGGGGATGITSSFGFQLLGTGGTGAASPSGGTAAGGGGGDPSLGTGPYGTTVKGGTGQNGQYVASSGAYLAGGAGGNGFFGGGGASQNTGAGLAGATNTGGGGAGAGTSSTANSTSGGGGGAGGYVEAILTSPSSTYYYTVGTGGANGGAGTGGFAGGSGAAGYIEVTEYYQ